MDTEKVYQNGKVAVKNSHIPKNAGNFLNVSPKNKGENHILKDFVSKEEA